MTETKTKATEDTGVYARCVHCSAAVDADQRYCVACGARNQRARDPVARYLALASSRARAGRAAATPATPRRPGAGLATAGVIAVIPLAVAAGVLAGHSGSSDDSKLIAALRAQKPPVVNVTAGGTASSAAQRTASAPIASTFSLASGYAVELGTIPASGVSQDAVTVAERAARAKGASAVGVIAARDFTVTPKPPVGSYVLYSGQYRTRGGAVAALGQLKRRFPGALVVAVRSTAAASASASSASQVTPTATKQSLATGASEVKKISHVTGTGYVQAQNNLPGVVSVP